jgi:bacillithiol system protein YtxJ
VSMIALTTEADVEAMLTQAQPAWIFKHSSACGVSFAANEEIERFMSAHPDQTVGRVIIQTHRPLSNWIATRLQRTHQSPQLFLVADGAIRWATSHWGITVADMERALNGN